MKLLTFGQYCALRGLSQQKGDEKISHPRGDLTSHLGIFYFGILSANWLAGWDDFRTYFTI